MDHSLEPLRDKVPKEKRKKKLTPKDIEVDDDDIYS
jgi:hypothetical protein